MDLKSLEQQMVSWRHLLHQHPEGPFEEKFTAEFVASTLEQAGLEVCRGIGRTGVVATLRNGEGSSIGIRADMDSIPLKDQGCHNHVSKNLGRTHACGHDGHTVTLLGAALMLNEVRNFCGTVHFIFQPAEEPGLGAKAMLEDGLLERFPIDEIYGMHNVPFLPAGHIYTKPDGIMSGEDDFSIRILGRGCHASAPHMGIDPIGIGAQIYLALQTIVSRNIDPLQSVVVSCTEFLTDGVRNAIPNYAELRGDIRTFSAKNQQLVEARLRELSQGLCKINHAGCEVTLTHEISPVINTLSCVETAVSAAKAVVGEQCVNDRCEPWMASEDFAEYLKRIPGCFVLMGSDNHAVLPENPPLHNSMFDYNDQILLTGAKFWAELVSQRLS